MLGKSEPDPFIPKLADVFQRDKFDAVLPRAARMRVLAELARFIDVVTVTSTITDCRDNKDNKFLALALDSGATCIVTGDKDLLTLHPWRGVVTLSPVTFFEAFSQADPCRLEAIKWPSS
mgnify:CR=1 FL=1